MPRLKRSTRKAHVSDDITETVRTMYQSGQSINAIAEEVSLSQVQIANIIKENGLLAGSSGGRNKDHPKVDIAMSTTDEATVLKFLQFLEPISWDWKYRTMKQAITVFANSAGIKHQLSQQWRRDFTAKNEQSLSNRVKSAFLLTASKSAPAVVHKPEVFYVIENLYKRLQIEAKPEAIWNYGSADVLLPEPPKKVAKKNDKTKEEHVSALYAVSAAGNYTPGTILFKGARIASEWKALLNADVQEQIHLLVNDTGFADHTSSVKWLKNFLRWTEIRPVVLFCDPVVIHDGDNFDFIKLAFDSNIHLVTIPKKLAGSVKLPFPHGVMGRIKDKWYEELDEMQLSVTPTSPLTRSQVVQAFGPTHLSMDKDLIRHSFESCGIYPLNADAEPDEPERAVYEPEKMEDIIEIPPLSPETEAAVNIALEAYARAGIPENKALKLLRNMNVPGFVVAMDSQNAVE